MRIFLGIFCLLVVTRVQAKSCSELQKNLEAMGKCNKGIPAAQQFGCTDLCTKDPISPSNCSKALHCCLYQGSCVLKTIENPAAILAAAATKNKVKAMYKSDLKNKLKKEGSDVQGKLFNLGGQLPPGAPNPYLPRPQPCLKFPRSCPQPYGTPDFSSPVNVPYCQRIACSPSNVKYDSSNALCLSQPGCFFDDALYAYRSILGEAILPGVPVCHLAIRSRIFHQKAAEAKRVLGSWNPYLTQCLIKEYRDEIFGESVGCKMLDLFEYFGHYPKRAGWPNIDSNSCYLIDGCWRRKNGGYCVYPLRVHDATVRSGNDAEPNKPSGRNFYGLPSCMPFSPKFTGAQFLTSYHQCLSRGCAVHIDRSKYWQQLYSIAVGKVPQTLLLQYLHMIYNGQVRADNYKTVIDQLKRPIPTLPSFPFPSLPNPYPNPGGQVPPGLLAYSLNLTQNNPKYLQFPSGGVGNSFPKPTNNPYPFPKPGNNQYPPQGGNIYQPLPQGGNPYQPLPQGGNPYQPLPQGGNPYAHLFPTIPSFPIQPPCPYVIKQYYGLPPLTGSVAGCCDKPLCYIPRRQLYAQYSGISSYLTEWTEWEKCSVDCGGGRQNRTRSCVGKNCVSGLKIQYQSCNDHDCPRYGAWGKYSTCSVTCGGGISTRQRVCVGRGKCIGNAVQTVPCNTGKCPTFGPITWAPCSVECGKGVQRGTSKCVYGGDYGCPEDHYDEKPCEIFCGKYEPVCNPNSCRTELKCVYKRDPKAAYCSTPAPYHYSQWCTQCIRSYNLGG